MGNVQNVIIKKKKIIQIKDTFHSNAVGNIAQAVIFFTKNKSALITFYIVKTVVISKNI